MYHGPRRDKDPRWVPAIITKVHGSRSVYVRACPRELVWRRHIEQLKPQNGVEEHLDPGKVSEPMMPLEDLGSGETPKELVDSFRAEEPESGADLEREIPQPNTGGHGRRKSNFRLPTGSEYGPHNR